MRKTWRGSLLHIFLKSFGEKSMQGGEGEGSNHLFSEYAVFCILDILIFDSSFSRYVKAIQIVMQCILFLAISAMNTDILLSVSFILLKKAHLRWHNFFRIIFTTLLSTLSLLSNSVFVKINLSIFRISRNYTLWAICKLLPSVHPSF